MDLSEQKLQPGGTSYILQKLNSNGAVTEYSTYMDDDAQLAGWKRYQQKSEDMVSIRQQNSSQKEDRSSIKTTVYPIRRCSFETRIFVHNLKPEELGALMWALDFGGEEICRHQLGMGRPFGLGGVQVHVRGGRLKKLDSIMDSHLKSVCSEEPNALYLLKKEGWKKVDISDLRTPFTEYMERQLKGEWYYSNSIQELLCIARPKRDLSALTYMSIQKKQEKSDEVNEFTQCKKRKYALSQCRDYQTQKKHESLRIEAVKSYTLLQNQIEEQNWHSLSPKERVEQELQSTLCNAYSREHTLFQLVVDIFQKQDNSWFELRFKTLSKIEDKEALRSLLKEFEELQSWKKGRALTNALNLSKEKLKSVYQDIFPRETIHVPAVCQTKAEKNKEKQGRRRKKRKKFNVRK